MKKRILRSMIVVGLSALTAIAVMSQERVPNTLVSNKYLISAKAGGVNLTEGAVTIARVGGTGGVLLKGDQIEVGDKVSTGADGRVEILLNPGSYLRLGANSSAEFKTTSLDDLQIKLDSGSAMFEVFATSEFTVTVFTPKGTTKLIESGVYRFDIASNGSSTIAVTEGKALVGTTEVKEGRTATIDGRVVVITKFDRDKRDDLATWSRTRSKVLAAMTASLRTRDMRDSLMSSFYGGRWGMMDSFGLWVLNPRYGTYCFLPFGYGWYSPYGYGFGPGIYWYNLPPVVYNPPSSGASNTSATDRQPRITRRDVEPTRVEPPYTRIEREREPVRPMRNNDTTFDVSPTKSAPMPTIINSPPPPPPPPPPASTNKRDGN